MYIPGTNRTNIISMGYINRKSYKYLYDESQFFGMFIQQEHQCVDEKDDCINEKSFCNNIIYYQCNIKLFP